MVKITATTYKYLTKRKSPVIYKKTPVIELSYTIPASVLTIKKFLQAVSDDMHDSGFKGEIQMAIKWPVKGKETRSGKFTVFGGPVNISYPNTYGVDIDTVALDTWSMSKAKKEVFIMISRSAPTAGGSDDSFNDCLYECLVQAMHDDIPWKYAAKMKIVLGLDRKEKVDIAFMQKIESKLKTYKINVSGDHTYISTKPTHLEVQLKLVDGHYTLIQNTCVPVKSNNWKARHPLFRENVKDNSMVRIFDGIQDKIIEKEEFIAICQMRKYIVIPMDIRYKGNCVLEYSEFRIKADILKKESNGIIDMYKTGTDIATASKLFKWFQKVIRPTIIGQIEGWWIMSSSTGSIMYSTPYTGPGYEYDVISEYPSIMANPHILFPVECGTFGIITTDEMNALTTIPYGIYRCTIEHKPELIKIFRYNPTEYYTHVDLIVARELKLSITMLEDGTANQLVYRRGELVTAKQLFGKYVHYLFDMKQKGIDAAKPILNVLWGYLCKDNVETHTIAMDSEVPFEIPDDCTLLEHSPLNKKLIRFKYFQNDNMFSSGFARIKPFILAYGRQIVRSHIGDNLDSIVRIHTDGFISTQKLDVKLGSELGCLKYNGYCEEVTVVNVNNVIGKFE